MQEDILSTQHIFRGRVVTLDVHTVQLPDGSQSSREIITHPGAVAVVAVDVVEDEYYVLLVKQYRTGAGKVTVEIPAGLLEVGEDPEQAAIRELREETGFRPTTLHRLGGVYVAPGYSTEFIHLYYTTQVEPAPLNQDDDEFVEALRVPLQDALQMIEDGEIVEAKSVVALLRIARLLGV